MAEDVGALTLADSIGMFAGLMAPLIWTPVTSLAATLATVAVLLPPVSPIFSE